LAPPAGQHGLNSNGVHYARYFWRREQGHFMVRADNINRKARNRPKVRALPFASFAQFSGNRALTSAMD
jgi:hypothetical protein